MSRLCVPLLGYAPLSGNLGSPAATPTNYCRTLHVLPCDNDLRPQPRLPAFRFRYLFVIDTTTITTQGEVLVWVPPKPVACDRDGSSYTCEGGGVSLCRDI